MTASDLIPDSALAALMTEWGSWAALTRRFLGDRSSPIASTLNGSVTAADAALTLHAPAAGTWADVLPDVGTLLVGSERVRYRDLAGNVFTVKARGADGTLAAAHADAALVYVPTAAARLAYRAEEVLLGDGSALPGVGAAAARVVGDLGLAFRRQTDRLLPAGALPSEAFEWLGVLDSHLGAVAGALLTGVPSFGALAVSNLRDHLRYRNDPATGAAYALLAPDSFAELYWLYDGALPLAEKTVAPPRTTLGSGSATAAVSAAVCAVSAAIPRYSRESDPALAARIQGYAAPQVRARVTAVGTATACALTASCQGESAAGVRFGRSRSLTLTFSGVVATDSVSVNGVAFTAVAGGAAGNQFNVGGSNTVTAANFAAALNASVSAGVAGIIEAADGGAGVVTLSPIDESDYSEYQVSQTGGHVTPSRDRFGGGDGPDFDGTGDDASAAPRPFTAALDMTAVGNTALLSDGAGGRILEVISLAGAYSGSVSGAEAFVIESIDPLPLHDLGRV